MSVLSVAMNRQSEFRDGLIARQLSPHHRAVRKVRNLRRGQPDGRISSPGTIYWKKLPGRSAIENGG